MVYSSIVLVYSQFRRRIGTNSCLSSSNSSFINCRLISITIIRIAGVLVQQLLDLGSSTVQVLGGNSG